MSEVNILELELQNEKQVVSNPVEAVVMFRDKDLMMNKIYISHLLDMSDTDATNWLIENESEYVLVKKADLRSNEFEVAKKTAFKIGGGIREDSRINKRSQEFAVAIVLNHLSDLTEEYEET